MATGIVSIAAHQSGLARVALALLALNVLAYVLLWLLTLARLLRHRRAMLEDLLDHQRAPGYFTTVAASHTWIMRHPDVPALCDSFLASGRFAEEPAIAGPG